MEQLDTFLVRQPPFDELDPDDVQALANAATEQIYDVGDPVLVEDGPPAAGLWVILGGSMELLHEGEVIQILEPGETFGHPSLLTGLSPAFTVRARERSSCAFFDAASARRILGTDAGAKYVAMTMRTRLTGTGHTVHGLLDLGTTPVSMLMQPATFCEPDTTIREAARRLDEVPALLVDLGETGLGVITDAEVRSAVTAGSDALDAPLRRFVRSPVATVPASQLAVEATIDMLASGAGELAVVDGERVAGILTAEDLLGLDVRSPIAVRHLILGAPDEDELVRAVGQLPRLFLLLIRAGVPPRDLGRVLSLQHDAVVARLVEFSLERHGPAPVPWTWLDLGSAARREFTLSSDQDNALAYADPDGEAGDAATVDAYFEQLGRDVNDGLARCGIGVDNNGVLACKRLWRMSKSAWLRTFDECLEIPDESHLIRATVAFDFRPAAGGLVVTPELTERMRAARQHPSFMRLMARSASGFPVALGFRNQLATGRGGDPPGLVDLKRGAIIPVVNLVRFHALAHGVTISPTLDRIEAVASVGGIDRSLADAIAEAFAVITRLRFEHHATRVAAGEPADNLINPDALGPIARSELREALGVVRRAQKQLGVWTPAGK